MNDYLRHEALDRTHMISGMIEMFLLEHPYIKDDPVKTKIAEEAYGWLQDLYQQIGEEHLNEPEHTGN